MCLVSIMDTIGGVKPMNFPFRNNVTLLGGGECSVESLEEALRYAPELVATDGAATRALIWGHMPDLVIGDMDSLDDTTKAALAPGIVHPIHEQDSTDFDKALRSVQAQLILGVGFLGARQDHSLACLNSLVRHADRRCILVGENDICFLAPAQLALNLPAGTRLSLFPMAEVSVRGTGLVYPVDGLRMRPWGQISTSNAVDSSGHVRLEFDGPRMLVLIERDVAVGLDIGLDAAIKALERSKAWDAR